MLMARSRVPCLGNGSFRHDASEAKSQECAFEKTAKAPAVIGWRERAAFLVCHLAGSVGFETIANLK